MGTSVFFLNVLYINSLPFLLFSRRESPRSSTSLPSFLYGFPSFSRRVFFPLFLIRYIPLFPPFLSLSPCVMINASPCGNGFFSINLPFLSIRFFLHRPLFPFLSLPLFLCSTTCFIISPLHIYFYFIQK